MNQPSDDRRWPRRVYGHGSEPDPRFSLANERTFLAWIRTTLALLAGAAAVHVFDLDVSDVVARIASILLAAAALGSALNAWVSWARTESALRDGRPLPSNGIGVLLVAAVGVAALIMLVIGARG